MSEQDFGGPIVASCHIAGATGNLTKAGGITRCQKATGAYTLTLEQGFADGELECEINQGVGDTAKILQPQWTKTSATVYVIKTFQASDSAAADADLDVKFRQRVPGATIAAG